MDENVRRLQEDLKKKLDCLCSTHNGPALHVANHFAKLRRQVDLDAEQLLSEVQSVERDTGKVSKDSDLNATRLEFIRILEELEKRTTAAFDKAKFEESSSKALSSLEKRVDEFKNMPESLGDLEDSYVQLAREIIDATDRVQKGILGEQTIIYWPSNYKGRLGSLVYFGDVFINQLEFGRLKARVSIGIDDDQSSNNYSLLLRDRRPVNYSKAYHVIKSLLYNKGMSKFGEKSKFFYIGKTEEDYSGYAAEGSSVEREFVSYQYEHFMDQLIAGDSNCFENPGNFYDTFKSHYCTLRVRNTRLSVLDVCPVPSPVERLVSLHLSDVHLESFNTTLLAKLTGLTELKMRVTFSKDVKCDLDFLRPLRKLANLELSLPNSPSDLSMLAELTELKDLKLEGSSSFYAEKLPRLSKAALKHILSPPRLRMLELACFDIEIIDQEMVSGCTLVQAKNYMARTIKDASWNFKNCFFRIKLINSDIGGLDLESFVRMANSTELSLSGNSITDPQPGLFQDLPALEQLDLDKNSIRYIRGGVFNRLRQLKSLKVNDNPIESIEANTFAQLDHLAELSLNGCRLKSIDSEMFVGLVSIKKLSISKNLIERIQVIAEDGRRINVAKANLSNEEKELVKKRLFTDLSRLSSLDLSGNKLNKLDLNCFSNLSSLQELDISSNKINELNGEAEPDLLPSLRKLNLNDNQLFTVHKRALPKTLTDLDLSKNSLTQLDEDFFTEFKQLENVNLAQNKLTWTITQATFSSCEDCLKEIDFSQNESIKVAKEAFSMEMRYYRPIACDFGEHFASMWQLKTLRIARLTPEILQTLKNLIFEVREHHFFKLDVMCVSKCSIKSLIRDPNWESNQETQETDHFNLSWFAKALRLRELDFSWNLIEKLDNPELFADYKLIKKINLSNNGLICIHRNIFKCNLFLVDLDLSGNKLSSIDTGLFRHLSTNLTRLNLRSNNITFLNVARLFRTCPRLESLDIADNQLDDRSTDEPIDAGLLVKLQRLSFAGNDLGKMDFVRDMTSLRHLDLRGNRIESVMSNTGEYLLGRIKQLTYLDISENRISRLTDEMFSHLRGQLTYLNLCGNPAQFSSSKIFYVLQSY